MKRITAAAAAFSLCLLAAPAFAQAPTPPSNVPPQPPAKLFDLKFTAQEVDAIYAGDARFPLVVGETTNA